MKELPKEFQEVFKKELRREHMRGYAQGRRTEKKKYQERILAFYQGDAE